ncbi:alpha/beta fold hydrolase [Rubrivivax rivuli]|uniref:Alpha/beta fold hydrolase n=1 Tax=Rubrivivax rivuli TaxID=1862385 RepID=A0A437RRM7_9BURK|nr:alpha/beta fold hydrolase [Rubrivivax rivuli]RVU49443.1 alpha/beta fold hydrolase [Rubrivivax rivuli]
MNTPPTFPRPRQRGWGGALQAVAAAAGLAALAAATAPQALAAEARPGLKPCRVQGVVHDAQCGVLRRPLDPAQPQGVQIEVHYAVLPALARNRQSDPVFFFAGGPGQSAIALGGQISRLLARLGNRRDVVLVDQRGTGSTAPLYCDEVSVFEPLVQGMDNERQAARLQACTTQLQKLPHGNLRHYTTTVAMQDVDAVRQALGAPRINLVGGSYGTRAVLEYMRQFPKAVRRAVIDGVAPPDMVLPAAFSTDNQAALAQVFKSCEADAACRARYPQLREDWQKLLASMPREMTVAHPVLGRTEKATLTRDGLLNLVRAPMYVPVLASALPMAIGEGAAGRLEPLVGLAIAFAGGGGRAMRMSEGMHFSVVCAEDYPRLAQATDVPGADFGSTFAQQYQRICGSWPRGEVPAAFYTVPPAQAATLVLSGGADPVTPPRHGERVTKLLGAQARHVVVKEAGHGVMGLGCMRDVLFRFINAESDAEALKVDASCAENIPRPPVHLPPVAEAAK